MDEQLKEFKDLEKNTNIFLDKLTNPDLWIKYGFIALKIIIIIILSSIIIRVGKAAIGRIFKRRSNVPLQFSERREATLIKLLQNILTYTVYFIAIVMILSSLNIDVTGILAGAGILGLAVGFGAQNLVKDVIGGFFIIFEDQFSVGDYVRIGEFEGTVNEIGLRTTKILNWTGELYILQNGNITEVTNFSLHNSVAVVDIYLGYQADLKKVESLIENLLETMPEKYEQIVETPTVLGIQQMGASEIVLRVTAETLPLQNWFIARELRKAIKLELDAHRVEIPYQRIVMMRGDDHQQNDHFGDRQGG
ncbi:MAG TPA: mechanosensitive ion channel family protein [Bacillus bacterium]|uniref:Mechanosensitive ion channel protein MscS n=2 Tax=Siminovitchia fordii TaxID=254759 RepID=A0ABQ4K8N3_9BACI|nr:mechanosensitive ion channel family protein [Siminovitchia fordii]GIN21956.1 mechanosensitive ion channel protein MscS [Siminovitchia fordii]HBZ11038.1 mechanosensitive ion channel family protein [Bacillus sp. (in: firmicutes)]